MLFCPKCGSKRYEDPSRQNCGISESKTNDTPPPTPILVTPQKARSKKAGCGCLIILIVFALIVIVGTQAGGKSSTPAKKTHAAATAKKNPANSKVEQEQSPKQGRVDKEKKHRAVVQKGAFHLIPTEKGKGYDRTLEKYGVDGINKINSLLPVVAEKAANSKKMDIIWSIDVADSKSTKDELVFYADAKNGNRIYISERELSSDTTPKTETEKLEALLPAHVEMCEKFIKSQLTHPSTYDKHFFSSGAQTDGRINRILITFSAKNSFNLEMVYEAHFIVNADGEITYHSIKEKQ